MGLITDILTPAINKEIAQLETRKKLRLEQVDFLENDKDFFDRITALQNEYTIEGLDPDKDMINGDKEYVIDGKHRSMDITESEFLLDKFKNDTAKKDEFGFKILSILNDFGLEVCFYDYVEYWVLYNKKPNWEVTYSLESLLRLLKNEAMIPGYPLTTTEKQFLKEIKRNSLGLAHSKGRITDPRYLNFLALLKQSKNSMRSSKLHKKRKLLQAHGTYYEYIDNGKAIKEKNTYKNLVMTIEESDDPKDLVRSNNRLRKANQRLRARKNLLKASKSNKKPQ